MKEGENFQSGRRAGSFYMVVGQNLEIFFSQKRVELIKGGECDKKVLRYF